MNKSTKIFLIIFSILFVVGVGLTVLFVVALRTAGESERETVMSGKGEKIALVEITGVIVSSDDAVRQIRKYREDKAIKGLLLRVDSPGGGVVPSQEIYEEVRKTRDAGKPVVVSMGSVAASGGYYIACGASRIVANRGSLTGSIGVVGQFVQFHEAMNKLGIEAKTIKSGKLKDAGSQTRPMSKDDEKYFQDLMDEVHRQFIEVVSRERKIEQQRMVDLADGRVFTGEHAVQLSLVDTIGTFEDAISIVAGLAGISDDPSVVREVRRKPLIERLLGEVGSSVSDLKNSILQWPVLSYRYVGPY